MLIKLLKNYKKIADCKFYIEKTKQYIIEFDNEKKA